MKVENLLDRIRDNQALSNINKIVMCKDLLHKIKKKRSTIKADSARLELFLQFEEKFDLKPVAPPTPLKSTL